MWGEITDKYWNEVKEEAARRKIVFDLEPDDAWRIFLSQNRRCAFTGELLEFTSNGHRGSASLDRIDSDKPYVRHNVQWTSGTINRMRGSLNIGLFKHLCQMVANPKNLHCCI